MVENEYLVPEEVAAIPTLAKAPRYVAYAPVDGAPFAPDLVLLALRPAQAMLVYEAALRAGATGPAMLSLGRPACALLPLAQRTGAAAASYGCKGNRVFTGLGDDEMYVCVPGSKWAAVAEKLKTVVAANEKMDTYYRSRLGGGAGDRASAV
jgi:uncharacterized protein (DUF169 family)